MTRNESTPHIPVVGGPLDGREALDDGRQFTARRAGCADCRYLRVLDDNGMPYWTFAGPALRR